MPTRESTPWELLVTGEDLKKAADIRGKKTYEMDVKNNDIQGKLDEGWTIKKQFSKKARMNKDKSIGDAFEDELWSILYKMGFKIMNATNKFVVVYGRSRQISKQIDIVAIDDETCLCIECKAATRANTSHDFRSEIMEIAGYKERVFAKLLEQYPGRKCKYIFAVKNYILGSANHDLLKEENIHFFDNSSIKYYSSLAGYIGTAARYQLLSSLFAGMEIEGLQNTVPAIKGSMNGVEYYTFLAAPEVLLKIGYVLHRTNANNDYDDLLPSYQRLIKKDRLEKVQRFISEGGYFPNSLVVSLECPGGVEFSPVRYQNRTIRNVGMLSLPKAYQTAFIIDGQHRLYGFANDNHSTDCLIPIVAFVNLSKETQLKLFMDINENQKAVPKPLRNILEIEVFYDSPNPINRKKALLGKIAKTLGEDRESPLYGRVVIGEDARGDICCITIEAIKIAFEKTDLFNTYKSNGSLEKEGLFEKEGSENETTFSVVYPLFVKLLKLVATQSDEVWYDNNSYITKNNNGVVAIIRILADIIDIEVEKDTSLINDTNALFEKCKPFVGLLSETIKGLDSEKREEVRKTRGTSGQEKPYRIIQMTMHENDSSFTNERIESYYVEYYSNYNDAAKYALNSIKKELINYAQTVFTEEDWMRKHLSQEHEISLVNRKNEKLIGISRSGVDNPTVEIWDLLTLEDMREIIGNGTNWSEYFKEYFVSHGIDMTKIDLLSELKTMVGFEKNVEAGTKITRTNYQAIDDLNKKLTGEENGRTDS